MDHSSDLDQIHQLKSRYFRLMDTKDWDGLREVFTPDVRIDTTVDSGTVIDGIDAYLPFLISQIGDVTTAHHGHMPEINVGDENTATGIWAMEDELWWPEGSPIKYLHGYGHYHETYVRTATGWKISSLRLTRLHRIFEFADPG
jgi:SnoaL-like domain